MKLAWADADSHTGDCSEADIASAETCIAKVTMPTDITDKAKICTYEQEAYKCWPKCACNVQANKDAIAALETADADCKITCGSTDAGDCSAAEQVTAAL